MKTSKLNIGLAISRNFDKVTLSCEDEPIEYETEREMRAKIRGIFEVLREEIELEYTKIQK